MVDTVKGFGIVNNAEVDVFFWNCVLLCRSQQTVENSLNLVQGTGSKLGKEYVKAVYCHPAYLTSMQSTSFKMLG